MRRGALRGLIVILLFAQASSTASTVGGPSGWSRDQRLTNDPAVSQLSYNFAWSIAADEAGRVHVVWSDGRGGTEQIYYKRSVDGGATWGPDTRLSDASERMPGDQLLPAIAVSGSRVYVAWHEPRNRKIDIRFRRSTDGGATWGPVTQLSTGPRSSAHASIAASGSSVHVVWGDQRDGGQAEIYYKHSTDRGATWEPEKRLTDLPFDSWVPSVAASGNTVYLAWVDTRDGNEEEYIKISRDGGVTWGPDTRLTSDRANSWAPSIAVSGKTVHLVWFDQKHSPAQPLEAEEKLDAVMRLLGLPVEPVPAGVMVPHPEAAAQRRAEEKLRRIQEAAPAWVQRGGDAQRLQAIMRELEQMGARGASYIEKEEKLDEAMKLLGLSYTPGPLTDLPKIYYGQAQGMRIREKMRKIHAALPGWVQRGGDPKKMEGLLKEFEQTLRSATREWEIYYKRSRDGGTSWGADIRLTNAPGLSNRPSIAFYGKDLHVVWFDDRDGNVEVYYKHSTDGGTTWGLDVRLTNAPGDSLHPTVAVSRDAVHVVWFDRRDGNAEIYYKRKVRR